MERIARTGLIVAAAALSWQTSYMAAQAPAPVAGPAVTFNKDALPILQKNCQACHRPGEVAPMSFLTYQDVRPYARAIKNAVTIRQMPPWFAEDGYAHYANDRRLSQADIDTLVAWADHGAVEGDAKDKPAPVTFEDGWNIKPDMVIEMPQDVPAAGDWHDQLPEHSRQGEFPGRQVGDCGRNASGQPEGRAPHARQPPAAELGLT